MSRHLLYAEMPSLHEMLLYLAYDPPLRVKKINVWDL